MENINFYSQDDKICFRKQISHKQYQWKGINGDCLRRYTIQKNEFAKLLLNTVAKTLILKYPNASLKQNETIQEAKQIGNIKGIKTVLLK